MVLSTQKEVNGRNYSILSEIKTTVQNISNSKYFFSRLRYFVEAGIVKHRLNYGLPKGMTSFVFILFNEFKIILSLAEICPQNLQSIERQLRLTDLMTTYLTMLVGFSSAAVVFFVEVTNDELEPLIRIFTRVPFQMMLRYVNGRKDASELTREQGTTRRINVQPSRKLPRASFVSESTKTISPPPAYGEAIKTIFNSGQNSIVEGKAGSIESYRTLNGRTYAVVKVLVENAALYKYGLIMNLF